jgi:hypothetical protein
MCKRQVVGIGVTAANKETSRVAQTGITVGSIHVGFSRH